jgi:hypothetical protein
LGLVDCHFPTYRIPIRKKTDASNKDDAPLKARIVNRVEIVPAATLKILDTLFEHEDSAVLGETYLNMGMAIGAVLIPPEP